jgi:hypothetical protein
VAHVAYIVHVPFVFCVTYGDTLLVSCFFVVFFLGSVGGMAPRIALNPHMPFVTQVTRISHQFHSQCECF